MVRLATVMALVSAAPAAAQVYPFTSGPIPMCDTSTFTANVSGVGILITPNGWDWGPFLENVVLNITTNHPQTLQITLTSPAGTTLLLSAFNGAGGQNYTNTNFPFWGGNNITTGSAPFTGFFSPQVGSLEVFSGQNANGVWTITVIDTACAGGGPGPGGPWTPGWFNGGVGSGAFTFGYSSPPPPCWIDMGSGSATICPGETADVLSGFESVWWWDASATVYVYHNWSGTAVLDPYAVSGAGTYYIEVSDWWNGCTFTGNYTVNVATPVALGPDQFVEQCSGAGPVNLTVLFPLTSAWQSWSWGGAAIPTSTVAAATVPGVYTIIGSNAAGCNDTAFVTLGYLPGPMLGPDQSVTVCSGTIVDLTALFSTGTDATEWTAGGIPVGDPASVLNAGTYTLVATNSAGCSDTAFVALMTEAAPNLGPDQTHDLCSNSTLDLNGLYNTSGFLATWQLGGIPLVDPSAVSAPGVYELFALSTTSCTDTAFVTVNQLGSPALGPDHSITECAGAVVDLTGSFDTSGMTASWFLMGASIPDPTAIGTDGTYTLIATNAAGCSDTAAVVLAFAANPLLGPDQQMSICDGTTMDLTTLYATGGASVSWSLGGVAIGDPSAVTSGGAYTVTVTNASGCTASAMVTVSVDPSPSLGGDQSAAICKGTSFDLTALYATAGLAEAWTINGSPVADPSSVTNAGGYRLVVTNGVNCTDTAWVMLAVNANPSLGNDQFFTLCPWQTVDLSAAFPVGGLVATYAFEGVPLADATAIADSGAYTITVTDAGGCTDEAMAFIINVECLCVADFIADARCLQDPARFTLLADSAIIAARWDFEGAAATTTAIDPEVRFTAEEDIRVTLEATLSCGVVTVEHVIRIADCSDSCSVWLPNAFTPDKDDRNDAWTWRGECEPDDFSVAIFNRWGELVFSSTDPRDAWDGSYLGGPAPDGVYAYRVGYRLPYQKHRYVAGSITLVR